MKFESILLFARGLAMGAANVIPGVSGGTVALVTGIYERLILALRGFDLYALLLLRKGRIAAFWKKVDGTFLSWIIVGSGVGILSLARLFEWLLAEKEILTFGFFFGLIMASVFHVGREVKAWNLPEILCLAAGTAISISIFFVVPAAENSNPLYLLLCGVFAICSMILPGLSGSFILILMGNYRLVLKAINTLDFSVLLPLALGCGVGLLGFAQIVGWLFKRFPSRTLATMTGFVLGSLLIIWPWKNNITQPMLIEGEIRHIITGYQPYFPDPANETTLIALGMAVMGGLLVTGLEMISRKRFHGSR